MVKRKNKVSKVDSTLSDVIELNDQAAEVAEDESTHENEEEILQRRRGHDVERNEEIPFTKRGTIRKRGLKGESRNVCKNRKEFRKKGLENNTKTGKMLRLKNPCLLCYDETSVQRR